MATDFSADRNALAEAFNSSLSFGGTDLTRTLKRIESSLQDVSQDRYDEVLRDCGARAEILGAAGTIKRLAGQINVIIHALGSSCACHTSCIPGK
jgi:hypothetical protein